MAGGEGAIAEGRGHQPIVLANVSRKLYGHEKNWTESGVGAVSLDPPAITPCETLSCRPSPVRHSGSDVFECERNHFFACVIINM